MRKQLLEFDDVANDQRKVIYQQRRAVSSEEIQQSVIEIREEAVEAKVFQFMPEEAQKNNGISPGWSNSLSKILICHYQLPHGLKKTQRCYRPILLRKWLLV